MEMQSLTEIIVHNRVQNNIQDVKELIIHIITLK